MIEWWIEYKNSRFPTMLGFAVITAGNKNEAFVKFRRKHKQKGLKITNITNMAKL